MTDLIPFSYDGREVRTVLVDGEPEFVAVDVCRILDHSNSRAAVAGLDDDEKGVRNVYTLGGDQQMVTVTEPGLYSLIIRSRRPEAKKFRRWITHEVLPQLRRTGKYAAAELSRLELIDIARDAEVGRLEAETKVLELETRAAEDAPKVIYVDTYVTDADLISLRTIAGSLNIQESLLREMLIEKRWIYRETATRWSEKKQAKVEVHRYSAHADKKRYFRPVEVHDAPRFRNEVMHTLKVTPMGAEAIARLVGRQDLAS